MLPRTDDTPTILLVDDNTLNLDLLSLILNKTGVNLICAESGQAALDKTVDVELALAMLDVRMPGMDGYELSIKLNNRRANNKVPIIFITANYLNSEEELKGYACGAVDYITKPFLQPILLSKVRVFIDLFQQKKIIQKNSELLSQSLDNLASANSNLQEKEQKQRQEQLFNKALLNSIPGIFYLYSLPDLKLVRWNQKHETIFGYRPDEMTHYSMMESQMENNQCLVKEMIAGLNEMEHLSLEANLSTKAGEIIPFLLTAVKFESAGLNYIMGVGTDISERKKIELALQHNESTLTRAQQIAHVGSWEYDYNSECMTISDETYRIFGFSPGKITPSLRLFYDMVHPDDWMSLKENIEAVKTLKVPLSMDVRIRLSNGEERIVHEQAEMIFDTLGHPEKWIGTVHDITQWKRTEAELKKSLEQLHQLSNHIEQVREHERLNLARELHDDLGQALTAVKIDLEIIKQSSSNNDVIDKLDRAKTLVGRTIKTVQRITSQLRPEIIEDLGLEAAIDWYTKEFAKRYGIEVFLELEEGLSIANEASLPLFRIMQESLTNIARHARASHIEISLYQKDGFIHFSVCDNGIGITQKQIQSKKAFGIMSMKERSISIGGTFDIGLGEAFGSEIRISFPVDKT